MDGAPLNVDSQSYGCAVLMQKGTGNTTEMFRLYDALATLPYLPQLQLKMGIDDKNGSIPNYRQAILSSDGGPSQMKALQNTDSLKRKRSLMIE